MVSDKSKNDKSKTMKVAPKVDTSSNKTSEVKAEKSTQKKEVKAEKNKSKGTSLQDVMVRISSENAEYVKMESNDGWYIGTGKPRVPDIHKDIKTFLSIAVKRGCALFATSGGIRVMKNANGEGGVAFIEFKNMSAGKEIFLFSNENVSRKNCESAGLTVSRESGNKGIYVVPKLLNGESAFDIIRDKFSNNSRPQGFVAHPWQGYEVHAETKRPVAPKKVSNKESSGEKHNIPAPLKKTPPTNKNPVLFVSSDEDDDDDAKNVVPVRQVKKEKKVDKKAAAAV